jgi:hypothetical protein
MNRFTKNLTLKFFGLFIISSIVGFIIYIELPIWFPKFEPGDCVSDLKHQIIYRITGLEDKLKSPNYIKARVLKTSKGPADEIYRKDNYVHLNDTNLIPVACP